MKVEANASEELPSDDHGMSLVHDDEGDDHDDSKTEGGGGKSGQESTQGQGFSGYNFQKGTVNYKPFNMKSYEKIRDFYGFSDALPQKAFFVREDHMAAKGRQAAHK